MFGTLMPTRRRFPATFARFENDLERFWDPVDRGFNQEDWEMAMTQGFPRANVKETDEVFEVTFELPGMKPNDVKVEFQNGALLVFGEKKEEIKEKGWKLHRIERAFGQFNRRIDLPGFVKEAEIKAEFEDGVLKVFVPKSEEMKPKQIKIKVH